MSKAFREDFDNVTSPNAFKAKFGITESAIKEANKIPRRSNWRDEEEAEGRKKVSRWRQRKWRIGAVGE